jgi:hypothetical protein
MVAGDEGVEGGDGLRAGRAVGMGGQCGTGGGEAGEGTAVAEHAQEACDAGWRGKGRAAGGGAEEQDADSVGVLGEHAVGLGTAAVRRQGDARQGLQPGVGHAVSPSGEHMRPREEEAEPRDAAGQVAQVAPAGIEKAGL